MKKTVLIIDDSAPIRYLLEAILGAKYKIVTAMDVPTAMLWLAAGNKPDLIISDIQMPHVDGWELIKYLNGNSLYNDVPLIVLSGTETPDDTRRQEYHFSEFIHKPFDPAGLMNSVERNLNNAAMSLYA
ncbi:response regulator [Chitinophaga arvensicola]|uniref:Response regulator receiver domain-containing protein n=1 Tax=Chitinophaga arvensicola TaxID=29529 RepID=A0A1I0S5G3_9BACT|nr:response regulator [Chitinophaga arvensicola]SEW50331.1 Response regulator receiver domain-containing protein [Chitinophaga arvensicola]